MNSKDLNQPYRRNIMKDDKTIGTVINADSNPVIALENEMFVADYVEEVNGPLAVEVQDFAPTRHELIQLVKYWAKDLIEVQYDGFFIGPEFSIDLRLDAFPRKRISRIAEVLGEEAVRQAIDQVYAEIGEKQDQRLKSLWEEFLNGNREQWDEVLGETHKALEETQEEDE